MTIKRPAAVFLALVVGGLLVAVPACGQADTKGEGEESASQGVERSESGRFRLLPIPIFITEPAIGEGLGVALALFHPVKGGKSPGRRLETPDSIDDMSASREAPPVVTAVAGAYTNNDTWIAGIGHANNWRADSIRYVGGVAGARVNSRVYLLGLPLSFSMDASIIHQKLKFRAGDSDFMIGFAMNYLDADNRFGLRLPDGIEDDPFRLSFRDVGLAGTVSYDTRNNTMNPRTGQLVDFSIWRYDEAIGGNFNYWSAGLKVLGFHSPTERLTLGLRAEFSAVDGSPPFYAFPFVSLRGIPALRYQDEMAGALEAELRYLLAPKWEISAFAGLGYVSDKRPAFENPDSIYNYGLGGRYQVFDSHNVWMGLDIARGPEDWHWYISVGHPW
jgi:hypothetical protein